MSRVARMPIAVPSGVDVQIANGVITAKGPLGTLTQAINPLVAVNRDGAELKISAVGETTAAAAMSGTFRALVANMVQGVSKGFERKLTLVGVGGFVVALVGVILLINGLANAGAKAGKSPKRARRSFGQGFTKGLEDRWDQRNNG